MQYVPTATIVGPGSALEQPPHTPGVPPPPHVRGAVHVFTSFQSVRPALHVCTVLDFSPVPQRRSPGAHAGGVHALPLLAAHSSGVAHVSTVTNAVRPALQF